MSAYKCPVCGEGFDFGKSLCGYGDKCMHASRLANERAAEIKRLRAELSAIKEKLKLSLRAIQAHLTFEFEPGDQYDWYREKSERNRSSTSKPAPVPRFAVA